MAVRDNLSVRQVEEMIRERLALESALDDEAPASTDDSARGSDSDQQTPKLRPPGLLELEELLASHLDTRVAISMSARHGRVTIDFADLEDLERIYRRIIST